MGCGPGCWRLRHDALLLVLLLLCNQGLRRGEGGAQGGLLLGEVSLPRKGTSDEGEEGLHRRPQRWG